MYTCYVCDDTLNSENETVEHIVLNAIGGKLKSRRLICRDCNSKFGSKIDTELAKQLSSFCTLLNIQRESGTPQSIKGKYKNTEVFIEPGGKIKRVKPEIKVDGNRYHIVTSDMSQARTVLKGLKRKFPKLNIEEELEKSTASKQYIQSIKIGFSIGGKEAMQSVCKSAINFYMLNNGEKEYIKHLIPYIQGKDDEAEIYYFYPNTELFFKDEDEIFHSLILIGDPLSKKLMVYVELFNELKFLVILNREYVGEKIYQAYHYNVVKNEVVEFDREIIITNRDIKKFAKRELEPDKVSHRVSLLMMKIDKIMVDRKINEITTAAMAKMLEKYPQETNPYFTSEMLSFISNEVATEFVLSFQHRMFGKEDGEEIDF
ncbi:HNH endonuclease [Lysinibacillus sp. NPDC098008]|uniref:HNH endonuclease n=1 Tax=Lysinibacillus sp. NPDC098008 TaxID=3364146 RepID=UPI0037F3A83D